MKLWSPVWPLVLAALVLSAVPVRAPAQVGCFVVYNTNYPTDAREIPRHVATLRSHLALLQRLGLQGDYWFTWLAADMVAKADPALIPALRAAGHGLQHHGANRPPSPTPVQRCKGRDFWQDVLAILDYETHDIDPLTGRLIRSRIGGMLGLQTKYGVFALCDGRMVKAPIMAVERAFGVRLGVGFGENSGAPSNQGWFMGLLGRPDLDRMTPTEFKAWALHGGVDPRLRLEAFVKSVPPGTFAAIALLMHDWDWFRNLTPAQQATVWQKYEEVLAWAKNHNRIRIMTMADVWAQVRDDRRPRAAPAALDTFAADLLNRSGPQLEYPVAAGGAYLSLADLYVMLVESVVLYTLEPKKPSSDTVSWEILGPLAPATGLAAPVTLSPSEVQGAALEAAQWILTHGMLALPATTRAGGHTLNAAELLIAMARFYRQIHATGKAGPVRVGPWSMLPALAGRKVPDVLTHLQHWTYKPAFFRAP